MTTLETSKWTNFLAERKIAKPITASKIQIQLNVLSGEDILEDANAIRMGKKIC